MWKKTPSINFADRWLLTFHYGLLLNLNTISMSDSAASMTSTATRAIVFAVSPNEHQIDADVPLCLIPLGSKTIVEYTVEAAVRLGANVVHVVVADRADEVQEVLWAGSQLGIAVKVHRAANSLRPYSVLKSLLSEETSASDQWLILHTSALVPGISASTTFGTDSNVTMTVWNDLDAKWSGVAQVSATFLRSLAAERLTWDGLCSAIRSTPFVHEATHEMISLAEPANILEAQRRILSGEFPNLSGSTQDAGSTIRIGRNVQIHPTAKLIAPCYIADDSCISAGATVGPAAYIGERATIGIHTIVQNSIVLADGCLAEELSLKDSIATRSIVLNTRLGVSLEFMDDPLLNVSGGSQIRRTIIQFCSRVAGSILFVVTLPALGILWLSSRMDSDRRYEWRSMVRTPTSSAEFFWRELRLPEFVTGSGSQQSRTAAHGNGDGLWRDFLVRVIPSLWHVATGRIRLVGIRPRSTMESLAIPEFWKPVLLSEPSGLIYEALVHIGATASFDESCTADMRYATSGQPLRSVRLLGRYLRALITGPEKRQIASTSVTGTARVEVSRNTHRRVIVVTRPAVPAGVPEHDHSGR